MVNEHTLPQLGPRIFLTDGGLETTLVFHDKIELPCFAAFDLLRDIAGRARLKAYYERYITLARDLGTGFILEAPTWRSNADWGTKLGYSAEALAASVREGLELMAELRAEHQSPHLPMVVSGCVGPRGDGYVASNLMSVDEARAYHGAQIATMAAAGADMVTAITMTHAAEAIGIARASRAAGLPVAISFTAEPDGRLPSGQGLREAILEADAETGAAPVYYMINCAHPTHFEDVLVPGEAWTRRVRGLRANASKRSHAELDEATVLDEGDPVDLGQRYRSLRRRFPNITVIGGCCGTDHRHVAEMGKACLQSVA